MKDWFTHSGVNISTCDWIICATCTFSLIAAHFLITNTDENNISLTFSTSVNPLSLMLFPSRWLSKLLTTILFSTSPSKRMNSNVLLEMRRDENCSGATMALTLSITSQLEMLFPGSLSWGSATLMVILAIGLRYTLYSEERQIASEVSLTMVVMVAVFVGRKAAEVLERTILLK